MLLAGTKGTFNDEEGLAQKSSVQSIMHCIVGYIRLWVSGIYLCYWKLGTLLDLLNWNTSQ